MFTIHQIQSTFNCNLHAYMIPIHSTEIQFNVECKIVSYQYLFVFLPFNHPSFNRIRDLNNDWFLSAFFIVFFSFFFLFCIKLNSRFRLNLIFANCLCLYTVTHKEKSGKKINKQRLIVPRLTHLKYPDEDSFDYYSVSMPIRKVKENIENPMNCG